ncbi:hypothetical protein HYW36_02645 [Candidatus Saccharibacteria bacterium]|nr:hypothetical protein [Candidatus Saccharibacteria bacterium]
MTNGEARSGSHDIVFDEQELTGITKLLEEASSTLISWATSEQSDSVRRQQLRRQAYSEACKILERIYHQTHKYGLYVRLNIPEEPEGIRTRRLDRNAYGLIEISTGEKLEPGESLLLKHKSETWNVRVPYPGERNVYYGDFRRTLEVADIARILASGGSLDLIDEAQATSAESTNM